MALTGFDKHRLRVYMNGPDNGTEGILFAVVEEIADEAVQRALGKEAEAYDCGIPGCAVTHKHGHGTDR